MDKLERLLTICREQKINLDIVSISDSLLGLYVKLDGIPPTIAINKCIVNDKLKYIEVLAEELGHHFTMVGDFSGVLTHYKDRLLLNKIEQKALRWACDTLMPVEELLEAFRFSTSLYEAASRLGVPHHMLVSRLEFLGRETKSISHNGVTVYLNGGSFYVHCESN